MSASVASTVRPVAVPSAGVCRVARTATTLPPPRAAAAFRRSAQQCSFTRTRRQERLCCVASSSNGASSENFTPIKDLSPSGELAMGTMVSAIMTRQPIQVCYPDTTVDEALEILGTKRLTGMPVVERDSGKLVGILSDFDLISLEDIIKPAVGVKSKDVQNIFPATGESWMAFKAVKRLVDNQLGKTVEEVMSTNIYTVRPDASIEDAARLLLIKDVRRLPVCDEEGNMVGIVSRSNIVQAALKARRGEL